MPGSGGGGPPAPYTARGFSWIHDRVLFSLSQGINLADPNNWLADLQRQTRGTYPHGLLQAILRKNRPVLGGGMQSCYFHQIKAAIARQDPISLNHRVAAWLASYFDILFAINGQFHPGEKRLLIYAEEVANLPSNAVLDVQHLCAFVGKLDTPIVAHVERMLERLDQKLIDFRRVTLCITNTGNVASAVDLLQSDLVPILDVGAACR